MLTRIRTLEPGTTCLVHAAGGAVGTALLELGPRNGAGYVWHGITRQARFNPTFEATPIDYKTEDFQQRIMAETGGKGVDVVFDTIGGKNWSRSYRCLDRGGMLIAFGALQVTHGRGGYTFAAMEFCQVTGRLEAYSRWAGQHLLQYSQSQKKAAG